MGATRQLDVYSQLNVEQQKTEPTRGKGQTLVFQPEIIHLIFLQLFERENLTVAL